MVMKSVKHKVDLVDAGMQTKQNLVQQSHENKTAVQMHSNNMISNKLSALPPVTNNDQDISLSPEPEYVTMPSSFRNSVQVYPRVYSVESVRQKESEQVNPQNNSK